MKINKTKLCACFLVVTILTGSISGCSSLHTMKNGTEAKQPVSVEAPHYVTGTLHKVNVTESDRPFIVDHKTEYKIIAADDEGTQTAVQYLIKYIAKGTKCSLTQARPEEYKPDGKFIIFNMPELFAQAGLSMPEDDLDELGYYIKSVKDNVFVAYNTDEGARGAMLAFLRNVLGFKFYTIDAYVYDKDGTTLPDMDIIERPDMRFVSWLNAGTAAEEYYMYGMARGSKMNIKGIPVHNTLAVFPMDTYRDEHPKFYSTYGNDICFAAQGDAKEFDIMTTIAAEAILESAEKSSLPHALITLQDVPTYCECAHCRAEKEKYGTDSAVAIKFLNKVNEKVQRELQRQADAKGTKKRKLYVGTLAYLATRDAPAIKNPDGSYSPVDESVVCAPEVTIEYAPIEANFTLSFYNKENQGYAENLKAWNACCKNMNYWLYEANYNHYMIPYNTWEAMLETYRFAYNETEIETMSTQPQHRNQNSTGFTVLKDYMNSCAAYNLNTDFEDIVDDFFGNYYMAAKEPMLQYFNELQAWERWLMAEYPTDASGSVFRNMAKTDLWPPNLLLRWLDLINDAYEAVEVYKDDQPALYNSLIKRIKLESIFPRFALIELHAGVFSVDELLNMKLTFKDDCTELKITHVREGAGPEITLKYKDWGI